jgi:hypothetical protein
MHMDSHRENGELISENWNAVFESLSAEPRRQLIVSLMDAPPDQSVPLPESAMMPNVPQDPEVLRTELYHNHLPILADMGFVTWEKEPLVASRGSRFDEVAVVSAALQSAAFNFPDSLVFGCQRLEQERQDSVNLS